MGGEMTRTIPLCIYAVVFCVVISYAFPAQSSQETKIATFDGNKGTTFVWEAVNDPVMGGQSYGNFSVDTTRQVAVWEGEVKIVPFLHAPGFCNAQAPGLGHSATFPSAVGAKAIKLRARVVGPDSDLDHFNVMIMTKGGRHLFKQANYLANYTLSHEWQEISISISAFQCSWRGEKESGQRSLGRLESSMWSWTTFQLCKSSN